jgi:hypothetical protein
MKITKTQLKQIVEEETQIALNEGEVEESLDMFQSYAASQGPMAEFFVTLAAGSLATIFLLSGSMALGLFAKFLINEFGQAGQKAVEAIKNKDEKGWEAAQKQFNMEDSIKESANMKITKDQIEQIIAEESEQLLREGFFLDLLDFVLADKPAREARQQRKQIIATWNDEELQKWTDEEWPKILKQIKGRAPRDQRKIIAKAMDEFSIENTYAGFHDQADVLSTSRQKRREDEKDQAAAKRQSYEQGLRGDKEFASRDPGKTKEYNRMVRKATRRIELGQGTPQDDDLVALGPIDEQQLEHFIREELEAVMNEKFKMPPELVKKCQKLASDIKMNAGISQDLYDGSLGGKYNSAEIGYAMMYRNFMEEAQKVYKQMECDNVLSRGVNEELYPAQDGEILEENLGAVVKGAALAFLTMAGVANMTAPEIAKSAGAATAQMQQAGGNSAAQAYAIELLQGVAAAEREKKLAAGAVDLTAKKLQTVVGSDADVLAALKAPSTPEPKSKGSVSVGPGMTAVQFKESKKV